jgi:hypothetical protein
MSASCERNLAISRSHVCDILFCDCDILSWSRNEIRCAWMPWCLYTNAMVCFISATDTWLGPRASFFVFGDASYVFGASSNLSYQSRCCSDSSEHHRDIAKPEATSLSRYSDVTALSLDFASSMGDFMTHVKRHRSAVVLVAGLHSLHAGGVMMLHLPEFAEVGTRDFARGIEDGAATFSARPIDSDPSLVGRLGKPQLGSNLNMKPKDCRVGSRVDSGRNTRTT